VSAWSKWDGVHTCGVLFIALTVSALFGCDQEQKGPLSRYEISPIITVDETRGGRAGPGRPFEATQRELAQHLSNGVDLYAEYLKADTLNERISGAYLLILAGNARFLDYARTSLRQDCKVVTVVAVLLEDTTLQLPNARQWIDFVLTSECRGARMNLGGVLLRAGRTTGAEVLTELLGQDDKVAAWAAGELLMYGHHADTARSALRRLLESTDQDVVLAAVVAVALGSNDESMLKDSFLLFKPVTEWSHKDHQAFTKLLKQAKDYLAEP